MRGLEMEVLRINNKIGLIKKKVEQVMASPESKYRTVVLEVYEGEIKTLKDHCKRIEEDN